MHLLKAHYKRRMKYVSPRDCSVARKKKRMEHVPPAKKIYAPPSQNDEGRPLLSAYNQIRPLLDAAGRLRQLKVTGSKGGVQLPTIVVIGDLSSGKSSVITSLTGIRLPQGGEGICTRLPLIIRFGDHLKPTPHLHLEYQGKTVTISELDQITEAIKLATEEITGKSPMQISSTPITLVVKMKGMPDLTMVDLPAIRQVEIENQTREDIITEYLRPKENVILNVVPADIPTYACNSIGICQGVDETGERTLTVVTRTDVDPEGVLEKYLEDFFDIGSNYVCCVRNRVGDESYMEAWSEESSMFHFHPYLSCIDKSMVGIEVLVQNLIQIQVANIFKRLPETMEKIDCQELAQNVEDCCSLASKVEHLDKNSHCLTRESKNVIDMFNRLLEH